MKLAIKQRLNQEICHYASCDLTITSKYRKISIQDKKQYYSVKLPGDGWKSIFSGFRLLRRFLRLDKCNIVPVANGFVAIRQGNVYHYNKENNKLTVTLSLKNCRNVLHQSIAIINGTELFFGEYGSNPERKTVSVYRSIDCGQTWREVYQFKANSIKHIHGCFYDPIEDKIWTMTGDFKNECQMICSNRDFTDLEFIGDSNQQYRACNAFFEKDAIHWVMDSQLQDSFHIRLDRKTRKMEIKQLFMGPVWYIKRLQDGYYLAATTQEIGAGVKDEFAHLMISKDLETWQNLYKFKHDKLPKKYFKFGIIGFADGKQTSDDFYLFFEAIKGFDGKTIRCKITE